MLCLCYNINHVYVLYYWKEAHEKVQFDFMTSFLCFGLDGGNTLVLSKLEFGMLSKRDFLNSPFILEKKTQIHSSFFNTSNTRLSGNFQLNFEQLITGCKIIIKYNYMVFGDIALNHSLSNVSWRRNGAHNRMTCFILQRMHHKTHVSFGITNLEIEFN